jgi:flagellin
VSSVLGSNLTALFAQRGLATTQSALANSVERMSSGLRINRAKDDAAGLGISEVLRTQVASINQGIRNTSDAVSMLQTAEGSLAEASSLLQRMKELTTQARDQSLSKIQRKFISDELGQLKKEITSIAERTTFNGLSLLKNALTTQIDSSANLNGIRSGSEILPGLKIQSLDTSQATEATYEIELGKLNQIENQRSRATTKLDGTAGPTSNPAPPQFLNSDFEDATILSSVGAVTTIPGWKIVRQQVDLGVTSIEGLRTPVDTVAAVTTAGSSPGSYLNDSGVAPNALSSSFVTGAANLTASNDQAPQLTVGGASFSPYIIVHGPYLVSTTSVDLIAGDTVSFKWAAVPGGDAYDVYAYLQDTTNQNRYVELLNDSNPVAQDGIATVPIAAGQEGNYRFVFIAGSFDYSGGSFLGGSLIVDDVDISFVSRPGVTSVLASGSGTARIMTLQNKFDAGDQISYTVTDAEGTVAALTYTVTAENLTRDNDGLSPILEPGSTAILNNIATAIASQYSLVRGAGDPVATVSGNQVTFSKAGGGVTLTVSQENRPAGPRTLTINQQDVSAGTVFSLNIRDRSYSVVAGTDMSSGDIAAKFKELALVDFPATATVSGNVLTFTKDSGLTVADMDVSVTNAATYSSVQGSASLVSIKSSTSSTQRTITIADYDVVEGSKFVLSIGNPEQSNQISVIAGSGDTAASIADKLESRLDDLYGAAVGVGAGSTVSGGVITLTAATNLGSAEIALDVLAPTSYVSVDAYSAVNSKTRAESARIISIVQSDLELGNIVSISMRGKSYSTEVVSGDDANSVAYRLAGLMQADYPNTTAATATKEFPTASRISVSRGEITLTADAKLGLDDIDVRVERVSDSGLMTLRARDAAGAISEQSIRLDSIAAGGRQHLNFDRLGVSFDLENSLTREIEINDYTTRALTSQSFTVRSDTTNPRFQVGADADKDAFLHGFLDLRLNGSNRSGQGQSVRFNRLSASIDLIQQRYNESDAFDIFGTLHNQIEDTITDVSTIRSGLGA